MTGERRRQGLLDTNIVILRKWVDPRELPEEMAISAITLAELSAGPHEVRRNDEQDAYDEHAERARRLEILQRAESEFDPVPFDAEAARLFGRVTAAVIAVSRKPHRRVVDLMIAATAIAEGLIATAAAVLSRCATSSPSPTTATRPMLAASPPMKVIKSRRLSSCPSCQMGRGVGTCGSASLAA